jgi:hypothetical protein
VTSLTFERRCISGLFVCKKVTGLLSIVCESIQLERYYVLGCYHVVLIVVRLYVRR